MELFLVSTRRVSSKVGKHLVVIYSCSDSTDKVDRLSLQCVKIASFMSGLECSNGGSTARE